MLKFKGAVVKDSKIILQEPVSQEELSLFCKDLYGGKIPVFKPVGVFLTHNTKLVAPSEAEYLDLHSYEVFANLANYTPVEPMQMVGAYAKQGDTVDLDVTIDDRKRFKERAAVATKNNPNLKVISPFSPYLDMNNIIQVFARTELAGEEEYDNSNLSHLRDLNLNAEELRTVSFSMTNFIEQKAGGRVILPERVKVKYSDFLHYGYDTYQLKHKVNPMVLFDEEKEILYRCGGGNNRPRTPIIICYRGTGEWDYKKILRTLFNPQVDKFIPFEHVRFNISNAVGVRMSYFVAGSHEIPLVYFKKVNEEALQKIITYYGEVE